MPENQKLEEFKSKPLPAGVGNPPRIPFLIGEPISRGAYEKLALRFAAWDEKERGIRKFATERGLTVGRMGDK